MPYVLFDHSYRMIYWKSLEQRCVEAAAGAKECLATASNILGPVQLSRLINWFAAHDLLVSNDGEQFPAAIDGLLCDEVRSLNLEAGNVNREFLIALAERCGPTLEFLRLGCSFKVLDDEISTLMQHLTNIRYLEIKELKIDRPAGVLSHLRSTRLERVFVQLYIRDTQWNEIETLIDQNPTIRSLRIDTRGRTLRNEDALLLKIADRLNVGLVELDLHNFSAEKNAISHLLLACRNLTHIRLTGSLQFEVEAMREVQNVCNWLVLELSFQVTPPRETYDALQYLPHSLMEISYKFGPSNRQMIVSSICSLPALKRIRYHTEFFNNALMTSLLSSLDGGVCSRLECLDVGLCDSLTDEGLDALTTFCPNLKELYLHSDTVKYNRVATCLPLCQWFDRSSGTGIDCGHLRLLYFNYFKMLSSDFLHIVAVECPNLEELHLSSVRCVNDALLKFMATHCFKLHTLDIMNCWAVTDRGVIALAERLPLVNLNVGMCYRLTEECVIQLAKNCPFLERFIYHGIPQLKRNPAIVQLQRSCEKRLKTYWYQWFT